MIIEEKTNWSLGKLFQIVYKDPKSIQNFTLKCCLLPWRRASESLTVTLKWAHTFLFFFEVKARYLHINFFSFLRVPVIFERENFAAHKNRPERQHSARF